MKDIKEMMKAAQEAAETVQKQMEEAQTKLDGIEVEGKSGGGLVSVKAHRQGPHFECKYRRQPDEGRRKGHIGRSCRGRL